MNYWTRIILYSFIPAIGFHLLLTPLWFLESFQTSAKATAIEMAFDVLILPVYLLKSNFNNSEEFMKFKLYSVNALIIMVCVPLSCMLHYFNWAISIGSLTNPDKETLAGTLFELLASSVITVVGLLISAYAIYKRKNKSAAGY
jgi:hypothetical protein